jgi:heme exporter protein A
MPATFPPIAVEARDLACRRGGRLVFAGLSFRAEAGTLMAVRGPNGAGKSSLLRILAGLLRPEAGSVRVEGKSEDEPVAHYLGHADALKPALTLRETLRFWAALCGGERSGVAEAAGAVGLAHALDLPTGVLSAGQRRRANLARLLLCPRPLWLLDEPTAALDRDGGALLGRLIVEHLAAGGLAIAATHQDLPATAHAALDLAPAA